MGLDVWLYRYEDFEEAKKLESIGSDIYKKIWGEVSRGRNYEDIPEAEKVAALEKIHALQKASGLVEDPEWGYSLVPPGVEKIKIDSFLHPNHMFKIGYWRSSYNSGGINSVLREQLEGKDLYYVAFGEKGVNNSYEVKLDWELSLERADEVKKALSNHLERNGSWAVNTIDFKSYIQDKPESESAALEEFYREYSEVRSGFSSYESALGEFQLSEDRSEVCDYYAFIPGYRRMGSNREQVIYAIYDNKKGFQWYLDALDVVAETLEYVLSSPDPEKYYLHWSG